MWLDDDSEKGRGYRASEVRSARSAKMAAVMGSVFLIGRVVV